MPETSSNVLAVIIAVVIILVILAVFILTALVYFNNRKLQSVQEKENLKKEFEQELTRTQLEVQEQTMRQISQEIHDNIGQVLSLVNLNLQTLNSYDPDKISNTSMLVNKAITDLRVLSKTLNPENLSRQGLERLLQQDLLQLERTGRFKTELEFQEEPPLQPGQLLILYRMIQEVLNNIIKHSRADLVKARVNANRVVIEDNGKGFNPDQEATGLGLEHLQQRARVIQAAVSVASAEGKGTIVTFIIHTP